MKVELLIHYLSRMDPEEEVFLHFWELKKFMEKYNIPAKNIAIVRDAFSVLDELNWDEIDGDLYETYINYLEYSQETPPVYDLGWEESPK